MSYKSEYDWKNVISLAIAVVAVLVLMFGFIGLYRWLEPEHKSERDSEKTEIVIETVDGHRYVFDKGTSKITINETVEETPLVDIYSSFLVAFISVLATFVVVANFVNAREVSKAADKAEEARDEAKKAKETTEEAAKKAAMADNLINESKEKFEQLSSLKKDIEDLKGQLVGLLGDAKSIKDAVDNQAKQIGEHDKAISALTIAKSDKGGEINNKELKEAIELFNRGFYEYALAIFRKYESTNNPVVLFCLGVYYYNGFGGVDKDFKKAFELYKSSAEQGHAGAQCNLGYGCYYMGKGVEQSYEKAVYWCEKAAEQGEPYAYDSLAEFYENGCGVPQNIDKAIELYKKAAKEGVPSSIDALKRLGVKWPDE